MIKCVIIDDEQPAINVLKNYIKRINNLHLTGTATNPLAGIELIKNNKADVVFLDIQMDEMTGIEVMNILDSSVQVIFCTAYSEFAVESYELNALDYLMKPIAFDRFVKAVRRIKVNDNGSNSVGTIQGDIPNDYIFVKAETKGKMIRINLDEIDYIEAKNNYVAIYCGNHITMVYSTMRDIEERLSHNHFIRVHKSFIIAYSKITHIEKSYVILKNKNEKIPVSKTYREVFLNMVKDKLFSR
ncbi:LytR/AlgR family response regulator transcription factor [Parafilimonas sp.]|uniref:LytR/AlgR family response regulator transcription factor n=1 Tax=Parafilimonas sp. TaxID=1969739 RepID=UPI0039E4BE61